MPKLPFWFAAALFFAPLAGAYSQSLPTATIGQDDWVSFSQGYADAWSSQNPGRVAAFFSEDGQLTVNGGQPAAGRAAIAAVARGFMEAFPDLVVAFDRLERKGERVLFHWTLSGTNTGPGGTGAPVRISGVEAWVIGSDGLIADSIGSFDAEDYTQQLAAHYSSLTASANSSTTLRQQVVEDDQINYVTGNPATWPIELEATIAAPDNHRILLENERVRVLEVTLGPGEVEPLHFHRWPSVLHIMQADEWIDRDAQGNVIFDSRAGPPLQLPLTMWKGPEAPHSPVNLSDRVEVRLIRVEIKDDPGEADLTPILDNRTRVILEGIRTGDVSGIMTLYGPGSLYAADNATLLSDPKAIEAFWVNVAASPAHDATLEVLRIERLGPDAFVEIQQYDVFDAAGERMFGGYASLLWRRVEGRWIIAADVSN